MGLECTGPGRPFHDHPGHSLRDRLLLGLAAISVGGFVITLWLGFFLSGLSLIALSWLISSDTDSAMERT